MGWLWWILTGAHNPEWATPILGLCQDIFTDQFIFSTFKGTFSYENRISTMSQGIWSTRYQKGKLNVNVIFRSIGFADWFVEFKRYSKLPSNCSKKKLVCENAVTQAHGSCALRFMGSWFKLTCTLQHANNQPSIRLIKGALQVQTSRKAEGPIHCLVEYHHGELYSYHPDICKLLVSNQ